MTSRLKLENNARNSKHPVALFATIVKNCCIIFSVNMFHQLLSQCLLVNDEVFLEFYVNCLTIGCLLRLIKMIVVIMWEDCAMRAEL